jgi:hypothetical protein
MKMKLLEKIRKKQLSPYKGATLGRVTVGVVYRIELPVNRYYRLVYR